MNTIEKIRTEIGKHLDALNKVKHLATFSEEHGYNHGFEDAMRDLLSFLDTLESETTYDTQQYTPRPSVDIEDVARVQFASHAKVFDKKRKAVFDWEQFKEVAGIFYGFGRSSSEKPTNHEEHVPEIKETGTQGMDEAAEDFARQYDNGTCDGIAQDCFKAGAEWQAEQLLKSSPLPEDTVLFNKGVAEGRRLAEEEQADLFTIVALDAAQRAKEQMMKEAVEGEVVKDISNKLAVTAKINLDGFKFGDKVHIIIVKEEEK